MKKLTCIYLFTVLAASIQAQNYFSKATLANDYIHAGGMLSFQNQHLAIVSEFCNGFLGPDCSYILKLEDDGSVQYLNGLGETETFDRSFCAGADKLAVASVNANGNMLLQQFNQDLIEIQQKIYPVSAALWIFDMIEYGNHYIISTYLYGTVNANYPSLYWINKNNLTVDSIITFPVHESAFKALRIDHNNLLKVYYAKPNGQSILTMDETMTIVDEWTNPETNNISYLQFEVLPDNRLVYGLTANKYLKCFGSDGQLQWEKDVSAAFGVTEINFIRSMNKTSDGDILLCGVLTKSGYSFGFMYLIDNEGFQKWKRMYQISGAKNQVLKSWVEIPGEGFLFYGTTDLDPAPSNTNAHDAHWALKTNYNGCAGAYCGTEIVVSTVNVNMITPEVYPNPVAEMLRVEGIAEETTANYQITDLTGKVIQQGSLVDDFISVQHLQAGIYFLAISTPGSSAQSITKFVKS
ncbi:MAG: T9SS type A sorting domain-containing protein [Saprospiraceae bacterium]|nr:T9SS type A sorting domain-containing protein [Saprospiraceae bacterium]